MIGIEFLIGVVPELLRLAMSPDDTKTPVLEAPLPLPLKHPVPASPTYRFFQLVGFLPKNCFSSELPYLIDRCLAARYAQFRQLGCDTRTASRQAEALIEASRHGVYMTVPFSVLMARTEAAKRHGSNGEMEVLKYVAPVIPNEHLSQTTRAAYAEILKSPTGSDGGLVSFSLLPMGARLRAFHFFADPSSRKKP